MSANLSISHTLFIQIHPSSDFFIYSSTYFLFSNPQCAV